MVTRQSAGGAVGADLTVGVTNRLFFYKNTGPDAQTPQFTLQAGVNDPVKAFKTKPGADTWRKGCVLAPTYADLNGDGRPDLVVGGCNSKFVHFLGKQLPASGELQDCPRGGRENSGCRC